MEYKRYSDKSRLTAPVTQPCSPTSPYSNTYVCTEPIHLRFGPKGTDFRSAKKCFWPCLARSVSI